MREVLVRMGCLLGSWWLTACAVYADVKLPALFSDHMVLQQGDRTPIWGTADAGEAIKVTLGDQTWETKADGQGRWRIDMKGLKASDQPTELIIKGNNTITLSDVLIGEVWICSGQSNMEWPVVASADSAKTLASAEQPMLRLFKVPRKTSLEPLNDIAASWKECKPQEVQSFSAVGYFFGRYLRRDRKVPIGLIQSAWGGTVAEAWTSKEALNDHADLAYLVKRHQEAVAFYVKNEKRLWAEYEEKRAKYVKENTPPTQQGGQTGSATVLPPPPFKPPTDPRANPNAAAQLYNGMIAPLQPFAIRGVIWYQGESNAGRAFEYRTLMPILIGSWRKAWNHDDMTFLMVQLAPYERGVPEGIWPELREAQWLTTKILKKCGMVVITDVGDRNDIHPKEKGVVGERLAFAARAIAYGEPIEWSGPMYEKMEKRGNEIVLHFSHVGSGLVAKNGPLMGFTICGPDQQFVKADARIDGKTVVVSHPDIKEPVAVRFGWDNYPTVNFYNEDGFPATPFRTDDFPMKTKPKPKANEQSTKNKGR